MEPSLEPQPEEEEYSSERQSEGEKSSSGCSSNRLPKYSVDELVAIFLDFYQRLTTLHYKPEDLKIPPPEGWGETIPEFYSEVKSELVIEVLRRLPYLKSKVGAAIHYKSSLLDYTSLEPEFFTDTFYEDYLSDLVGADVNPADCFYIAEGYESGGRQFILNVLSGEITEDVIRCDDMDPVDIKDFFRKLMDDYRCLRLIPRPGLVTQEYEGVPERDNDITEAEVCAQPERWGTDLDTQYLRQIYRKYGWPDAFQREEAFRAVDDLMDLIEDPRGGWEGEAHDPE
ncbi:hypothetical protein ACRALDRAFT_1064560 [Sodiomyces alcalophilus JCM 7366]|uniref:uncharacterized protein n=1 Tax=Sodiomyces alcalophilus JCM 7366 TaxID=591952 RepID=UPI0039B4BC89